LVNAIVGLMATGGSTNHTMHLIAIARAAGIVLPWDDFDAISKVTPLLCKLYPNGTADVNAFREAGGMSVVIAQLLEAGLVHEEVETVVGRGLAAFIAEPKLKSGELSFAPGAKSSRDEAVGASVAEPFSPEGGLKLLEGTLGRSVIKTSALKPEQLLIEAEALVFDTQEALQSAFREGKLERDFIAVVRYQGPKANGMPELHGLMPPLGVLQDKGYQVAIVTDGRMSGASGKVPSAIHMSPEAADGGMLARVRDGDRIRFDVIGGRVDLLVDEATLSSREADQPDLSANRHGFGRELFVSMRQSVGRAEEGACTFDLPGKERA
jgi:phosphogluconate dehydratase